MNSKFSKKIEITFSVKCFVLEDGTDISDTLDDSQVMELMDLAAEESVNSSLEYVAGEIIFTTTINDLDCEVYGWFDKKMSDI